MILVSGCPRSGTSVTMDILRISLGEENILGNKYIVEELVELEQIEGEMDSHFNIREYIYSKSKVQREKQMKEREDVSDLNPNGFWESEFTVRGISYSYQNRKLLKDLYDNGKQKVLKIVSQGLLQSDPKYIDKMIYLMRHPRNVAKSQERLKRRFEIKIGDKSKNIFDDIVVHTPEMYIDVTLKACQWFIENKDIPVIFIEFDDLQREPDKEIDRMAEFVGYGDFEQARDIVTPKLNRSHRENHENVFWEDAEFIYENFKEGKFEEILEAFKDPKRMSNRINHKWTCIRSNLQVDEHDCENCLNKPLIRENYKKRAEILDIDYLNEPCLYECGMNIDIKEEDYLTIEESIRYNSWAEDDSESMDIIDVYSNMDGCCGNQEDNAVKEGDVVVSIKGM